MRKKVRVFKTPTNGKEGKKRASEGMREFKTEQQRIGWKPRNSTRDRSPNLNRGATNSAFKITCRKKQTRGNQVQDEDHSKKKKMVSQGQHEGHGAGENRRVERARSVHTSRGGDKREKCSRGKAGVKKSTDITASKWIF